MPDNTIRYGFPYPQLGEDPNGPDQIGALAQSVDTALGSVQDQITTPQVLIGRMIPPGAVAPVKQVLGFQPQLVTFVCQVVSPFFSSGNPATYSSGRLGVSTGGGIVQDLTGVRVTTSSFAERRTIYGYCAGVIIDDTHISALANGTLDNDGFTLSFQDGGGADSIFMWTAYE